MSHLNLESLARLVDEAPTALEAAHLAACEACRDELQALHEQGAALASLPAMQPPPQDWKRLEQRLQEEGLIRTDLAAYRARRARRPWLFYGGQAAAAMALFVIGTLAGGALQPAPSGGAPTAAGTQVLDARPPVESARNVPAAITPPESGPSADQGPPRRLTANAPEQRAPRTAEEAFGALQDAESSYLDALARFAELSGSVHADDPAARLAALEGIVLTTRAALAQAPTDPVINGYHLTALAQRDAMLRQVPARSTDTW